MRSVLLAITLCAAALPTAAAYQVRSVPVRVAPFYEVGEQRADRPRMATNSGYDPLLVSSQPADIVKVGEAIKAHPDGVTPITLMVLAIRFYDVGLRDESVFWFYAARDRMATASAVLDPSAPEVLHIAATTRTFSQQAGPTINGYALCDVDRYRRIRREALDWVEKNPYAMLFVDSIPARTGDRRANLAAGLRALRADVHEESVLLGTPEEVAKRAAVRRESESDAKYCW